MKKPSSNKRDWTFIVLQLFLLVLVSSVFFIVIYSAMQEGNEKRRIIVPEALDAPYQPYRSVENIDSTGMVTPMDSMMRDVYVVQREINQGSHQLYLFFDTFTRWPAPLDLKHFDLKKPEDAQWFNFGIYFIMFFVVALPTISAFIAKNFFKRKLDNEEYKDKTWLKIKTCLDFITNHRIMIVFIVFMIAVLLSMVNLSIPLDKEYEYRADPFFVFVCFSSFAVAAVSVKYVIQGLKRMKDDSETSLSGKSNFRTTLIWAALGTWAMGFLCYFIGMYSLGTQKSVLASIVRPALESGKMFVLSDSVKEISFTLRNNGAFMGFYTICKLAFLLISSFAVVSLAWSRIVTYSSSVHRSSDPGELFVFFGINENSKILAHDVAQRQRANKMKKAEEKRHLEDEIKILDGKKKKAEKNKKGIESNKKQAEAKKKLTRKTKKLEDYNKEIEISDKRIKKLDEKIKEIEDSINELTAKIKIVDKALEKPCTIVMVENRNNPIEGMGNGMTISSLFGMFNFRKDAYAETRDVDKKAILIISDSAIGSRECNKQIEMLEQRIKNGEELDKKDKYDLFNSLGLKNLSKMIKFTNVKPGSQNKCHFFFLDDDARTNIDASDNFRKMLEVVHPDDTEKIIYCLARNNAFSSLLERSDITSGNDSRVKVKILDLSVMAVQSLFNDPDNHPINFVECDEATATVKTPFESLILGFGRSGRDIVRYLYEFGAFLDYGSRNDENSAVRSPFKCTIMDKNIDLIAPRYMAKIPAVLKACKKDNKERPLWFVEASLNSKEFVSLIEEKLSNLNMNYIVISIGDDKTNMGALTFVVDQAMRIRDGKLGKLKIFVRNYDPAYEDAMCDRANHYNQLLGNNAVVNIFGRRSELLSYNIVVDDHIITLAKEFHQLYKHLKGQNKDKKSDDELWTLRHHQNQDIGESGNGERLNDGITNWERQNYVLRQETQDIHNGIHFDTKLRLIGLKRQTHFEEVINRQIKMLLGQKDYSYQEELSKEQKEEPKGFNRTSQAMGLNMVVLSYFGLKDHTTRGELTAEQKEKLAEIKEHIHGMVHEYAQDQQNESRWWTSFMNWFKVLFMKLDSDNNDALEKKANEILEYLESETKYKEMFPFIDKELIDKMHELKNAIIFKDNGSSFLFTNAQVNGLDMPTIYRNLAKNEHIRWVASMEMLGYKGPDNQELDNMYKCDEAAKVHPGMVERNDVNDLEAQKTFDHMLIKCSFQLAYDELREQNNAFDAARKEALKNALEMMIKQAQKEAIKQADNEKN